MNVDITKMSDQELNALYKAVDQEIENRRTDRRNELIDNVIAAMAALHKEFPRTSINIEYECPYCDGYDEINILAYLDNLSESSFGGC